MRLSSIERALAPVVLSSFAPLAMPGGFAIAENEVDWTGGLERFLAKASGRARVGIVVSMALFFFSPFFVLGKLHTLAKASSDERAAAMERLLDHKLFIIREMTLLVKLVACMAMFRVTSLRERTNYDDPGHDAGGNPKIQLRVLAA